jgi:hypothetical protein
MKLRRSIRNRDKLNPFAIPQWLKGSWGVCLAGRPNFGNQKEHLPILL